MLTYNLDYQEIILVHPTRRPIFAGKPTLLFGTSETFSYLNWYHGHSGYGSNKCFHRRWESQVNLLLRASTTTSCHTFDTLVTEMSTATAAPQYEVKLFVRPRRHPLFSTWPCRQQQIYNIKMKTQDKKCCRGICILPENSSNHVQSCDIALFYSKYGRNC